MANILIDIFKLKPAEAIAFLQKKGYTFSWNWFEVLKEAHTHSFTVAKVMKADILQDIRSMVSEALNEGITFQQFKKELAPRLKKKGWWGRQEIVDTETGLITDVQLGSVSRLKKIYQANLQTSYMAGRYKQQIAVSKSRPYLQYISVIDGQTTDRCRSMHLRIFRADDPIWDYLYTPNHWGCRSRVRSLSDRQVDPDDIDDSDGKLVSKEVVLGKDNDKRTVSVTGFKLANGSVYWPDPGWDYNPGKTDYKPDLSKYDSDIRRFLQE